MLPALRDLITHTQRAKPFDQNILEANTGKRSYEKPAFTSTTSVTSENNAETSGSQQSTQAMRESAEIALRRSGSGLCPLLVTLPWTMDSSQPSVVSRLS